MVFLSPKHPNVSKTDFQVESATCMESSECSDLGRNVIIMKLVAEILSTLKVSLRCKVYYDAANNDNKNLKGRMSAGKDLVGPGGNPGI